MSPHRAGVPKQEEVRIENRSGYQLVSIVGKFTLDLPKQLESEIQKLASTGNVIIDCSQMSEISNSGVRVLMLLARQLKMTDRKLRLCSASLEINRYITAQGVERTLRCVDSFEEALSDLGIHP